MLPRRHWNEVRTLSTPALGFALRAVPGVCIPRGANHGTEGGWNVPETKGNRLNAGMYKNLGPPGGRPQTIFTAFSYPLYIP